MTRICIKCSIEKPIDEFLREKTKDGYGHRCKTCISKYLKEYNELHRDRIHDQSKIRYERNKQPYLDRAKRQRTSNPNKTREYQKEYRKKNRILLSAQRLNRLHTDVNYKLKHTLRGKLRKLLKGQNKTNSALSYLGCPVEFLKGYLEAKFHSGMNWENYGTVWHIDHVLPCRSFNFSNEKDRQKCFHYTNLQPLLVLDNLKKLDILPNGKYARHENRFEQNRPGAVLGG